MTVADLTYRNYDGPLTDPRARWWTIARQGLKAAAKRRALYIYGLVSAWYFLVMIVILFFVEQVTAAADSPGTQAGVQGFVKGLVWKDQFLHGFSFAQLILMLVALLLGAGSIANDNRANALLVYLAKPVTRLDYLIGKFVGIFIPSFLVMAVPTVVFYLYGALSFREYGFVSDDPWLLPKLMLIIPISAFFQTSLVLGVSSLFNQGRIAGATYAGLYFLTNFFTKLIQGVWAFTEGGAPGIVQSLVYGSVDGVQIGLAKAILKTDGTPPFGVSTRAPLIEAPSLLAMLLVIAGLSFGALFLAWRRIRAVEVVG